MQIFRYYILNTLVILVSSILIFSALERGIAVAITDTVQIVAKQSVTAEISLTVASNSLTMLPSIPGLTGGTGTASDRVSIITNNNTGYTVTLVASGTDARGALKGETQGAAFNDYGSPTAQNWVDTNSGGLPQFGFGITATGTMSGTGNQANNYTSCTAVNSCYAKAPTTSAIQIVNVNAETTIAGDSFTLKFRAHIPANSNPLMVEDIYAATTTLTATMN